MTKLFTWTVPQPDRILSGARRASVDIDVLGEALQSGASGESPATLWFNLSDLVSVECQTASLQWHDNGSVGWYGIMPGFANVSAHLGVKFTEDGACLSGLVRTLSGDWLIRSDGTPTGVWIMPSSTDRLVCGDPVVRPQQPQADSVSEYYSAEDDASPAEIDVLVLYPKAFLNSFSEAQIDAQLTETMMVTNTIFSNSDINARVRIIGHQSAELHGKNVVDQRDKVVVWEYDAEQGYSAQYGPDWELVNSLRNQAGADIVEILTDTPTVHGRGEIVGLAASVPEPVMADHSDLGVAFFSAYLDPWSVLPLESLSELAKQEVQHRVALTNHSYTFAHELGHLLGGKHDRLTQPQRALSPAYDYAHGYLTPDRSYVTIMGYEYEAEGIRRIPYFSNPDKSYAGQPLGIPLGQPGASDVAHLFRRSTRVVAHYRDRGDNAPHWTPAYLNLVIEPELGGFASPDQFGPYPQGSQVSVRATARAGYVFDHWLLDGVSKTEAQLSVLMDKDHTLTAVFVAGTTPQPSITLGPLARRYGCKLLLQPDPGPSFPSGTEIMMIVSASSAAMQSGIKFVWLIEGDSAVATLPLRQSVVQYLVLENDIVIELLPVNLRFNVSGQRSRRLNSTSQLVVQVSYGSGAEGMLPPKGEPIDVEMLAAPEGTTIVASDTTDDSGLLRITVTTGDEEGDLVLRLGLADAPERSKQVVVVAVLEQPDTQVDPVTLTVIENASQQIPEGATPAPVKVLVLNEGRPVNTKLEILTQKENHGIIPVGTGSGTGTSGVFYYSRDEGVATIPFLPQSGGGTGLVTIFITDTASLARTEAKIAVLPAKYYIYPLSGKILDIRPQQGGYQPFELGVTLSDTASSAHNFVTLPSGINLIFALDSGTTGITLATTEAVYRGESVYVLVTAPTAPGTAKVTVSSEHADPIVITINVS